MSVISPPMAMPQRAALVAADPMDLNPGSSEAGVDCADWNDSTSIPGCETCSPTNEKRPSHVESTWVAFQTVFTRTLSNDRRIVLAGCFGEKQSCFLLNASEHGIVAGGFVACLRSGIRKHLFYMPLKTWVGQ